VQEAFWKRKEGKTSEREENIPTKLSNWMNKFCSM
jgi:hypothetical protein